VIAVVSGVAAERDPHRRPGAPRWETSFPAESNDFRA
jgi:hypothetical protein